MRNPHLYIVVTLTILGGCSEEKDRYGRQSLSGTITFQGQPLDVGVIDFLSGEKAGARAMIQDGRYTISSKQGLVPGTYRVVITSPEANTTDPPVGPPGMKMPPLGKERIQSKYNSDSQETIKVTATGDNRFDFTIPVLQYP